MADITEIVEEYDVQLEIVETGGGQVEIIEGDSTLIEIVESTLESNDLDVSLQTNTLVVESTTDNTNVDISVDSFIVEATVTNNIIELVEPTVAFISQSIIQNINQTIEDWDGQYEGREAGITSSLRVSETLFTDILSASLVHFHGDGVNNILLISSGSSSPITVNHEGLIIFDEFTYTPTAIEGGLLYSGSDFYFGLEC